MTNVTVTMENGEAVVCKAGPLTAGMVGIPCVFVIKDDSWQGLEVTAVFAAGAIKKDVPLAGPWPGTGEGAIPHEVLAQPGELRVGLEGRRTDGTLVIPTTWTKEITVLSGANATGDPALAPTPSQYDRLAAQISREAEKKVDKVPGKGLSANDFTDADKEMLQQLAQTKVDKVPGKGLSANDFTDADKETLQQLAQTKVDKVPGKGLSTNDFTDADKQRITDLENNKVNKIAGKVLSTLDFNERYRDYLLEGAMPLSYLRDAKAGQLLQVGEADDYGKVRSWKTVDFPAAPDLAAGIGEPGYIANRTHWEIPRKTILEEITLTAEADSPGMFMIDEAPPIPEGMTLVITYNGVEYTCVTQSISMEGMSIIAVGNFAAIGGPDTGEPFAIGVVAEQGMTSIMDATGATSCTLKVQTAEMVFKLPNKFLDLAWLPEEKTVYTNRQEFVAERTLDYGYGISEILSGAPRLVSGQTYLVTWDGTEHLCTAASVRQGDSYNDMTLVYMGNIGLMGMGMDTGEPFLCADLIANGDYSFEGPAVMIPDHEGEVSHTVKLETVTVERQLCRMPEALLPESMDSLVLRSAGGKRFRVTVDEAGSLTAQEV